MNANNWRNNADGLPRPLARYKTWGYNVGGPVYWPGKFNTDRKKLFFFIAHEWNSQLTVSNIQSLTMPTAAERQGDFRCLTRLTDASSPFAIPSPEAPSPAT